VHHARTFTAARVSLAACAVLAASMTALPQPGYAAPDPDIESAQERVDRLFRQAEEASERYNQVRLELRDATGQIHALEDDVAGQRALVDDLRTEVGDMVAAQAQGAAFGPGSQLISSGDPDAFLSSLATAQVYSMRQDGMLESFEAHEAELDLRLEQMQVYVDSVAEAKQDMAQSKAEIDENSGQAQEVLADLEAAELARLAEQRAAAEEAAAEEAAAEEAAAEAAEEAAEDAGPTASGDSGADEATPVPPVAAPASGSAQAAVDFALAQVGDAYVYGAMGPDAWDCSGLTMGAWSAAGVSLPHSSGSQAGMGTAVGYSDMQPGDLVFYYSPVSHVGMYIGNGQLVHAANPSRPVEVKSVDSMPITTIRRVG